MAIGENLKRICKEKGITLTELSRLSGVSVKTIYYIPANDLNNINTTTMEKLCKALEVDSARLVLDPEAYNELIKKHSSLFIEHGIEPERQCLSVTLPEGVYLIEDPEPIPGLFGYAEEFKIVYPDGHIDITRKELEEINENIRRYVAFTLEDFKQENEDRLVENEDPAA